METVKEKPFSSKNVEPESYRAFIQNCWTDIHNCRKMEWATLLLVAGIHVAIAKELEFIADKVQSVSIDFVVSMAGGCCIFLSLLGITISCRIRRMMEVKWNWITQAEDKLGLIKHDHSENGIVPFNDAITKCKPFKGLSFPPIYSHGGLIILFYVIIIFLDIISMLAFLGIFK